MIRLNSLCSAPRRLFAFAALTFASFPLLGAEEEKKLETNVAVQVAKVVRTTLRATVTGYGTVESAPVVEHGQPAGGARLAAAASGLIVGVNGLEGARVEKDTVLVQLDARAAEGAVARARAAVTAAEKARARQTQLQAADGTSERALQEAEERFATAKSELTTAQFQLSQLAVRAPITGILTRLTVKPGEWLDAGKEIAEIVDPDRLVFVAHVPVSEATALRVGQVARLFGRLGLREQPVATATVQFVSPQISSGSDSVRVRLALPAQSGLRTGQFLAVQIVTEQRPDRLAVPRDAVYTDHDGQTTLSIVQGDRAVQKTVKAGLRDGDLVEVEGEGITEGAAVVTLGSYALPKETKITIIANDKGEKK